MMLTSSQWPGELTFVSKTFVSMFLCFILIVGLSPFGKELSHEPPLSLGNYCLLTPSTHPLRISSDFPFGGGGGMDIFWNHTIKRDDGSG